MADEKVDRERPFTGAVSDESVKLDGSSGGSSGRISSGSEIGRAGGSGSGSGSGSGGGGGGTSSSSSSSSGGGKGRDRLWTNWLAGAGAGAISSILCCPLDVAKVRMQVQGSLGLHKYQGGVLSTVMKIYREEGIRGPFKGLGPALITAPLFWGSYWPLYGRLKPFLAEVYPHSSPHVIHLLSAISAGAVADIITNPFWVTRTRIQTQFLHTEEAAGAGGGGRRSITTYQMMAKIYREEGILAFYRGLTASFLGLSHVAIQFPLYEHLKATARSYRDDGRESFFDLLFASISAKFVASTITYPHEVLRARMMDGRIILAGASAGGAGGGGSSNLLAATASAFRGHRLLHTLQHIVRNEGVTSLWAGLKVNLVRIVPATIATFLSYEYLLRLLN
eukprot:scaffold2817_cov177-Ochromonas_danica.AAC.7